MSTSHIFKLTMHWGEEKVLLKDYSMDLYDAIVKELRCIDGVTEYLQDIKQDVSEWSSSVKWGFVYWAGFTEKFPDLTLTMEMVIEQFDHITIIYKNGDILSNIYVDEMPESEMMTPGQSANYQGDCRLYIKTGAYDADCPFRSLEVMSILEVSN